MRTPPPGVRLSFDSEPRPNGFRARVRWTDPDTRRQVSRAEVVPDETAVEDFFGRILAAVATEIDPGITVAAYLTLVGNRWMRGIDASSTGDPYRAGMSRRVIPAFGHIPVRMLTAGLVDRVVDSWESQHSTSTLKCTLAALTRLLDEAVRDGVIGTNPARSRARRSWSRSAVGRTESPRSHVDPGSCVAQSAGSCSGQRASPRTPITYCCARYSQPGDPRLLGCSAATSTYESVSCISSARSTPEQVG